MHSFPVFQGIFGESKKVKWRGTWVVKTIIKTKYFLESKYLLFVNGYFADWFMVF